MNTRPFIVTMDGPAGVGKSTLAKRVAEALGVAYLDTGAMFRTVALHTAKSLGKAKTLETPVEGPALQALLKQCVFSLQGSGDRTRLLCNNRAVGDEIRSEEAGMMAAKIAQSPQVREFLKQTQRRLGRDFSLLAEGRDMGTVVFPEALCKIFLDAAPEIRAERRYRQLQSMGEPADLAVLIRQIRQRDDEDRNRAIAPLRPADNAHIIDTSHKDMDQVFEIIMRTVALARHDAPAAYPIRRKDRTLSHMESVALIERGEYGILALAEDAGGAWPYAVPLSYALMDGAVYFHCATEGRKLTLLSHNPKVCFSVVGATEAVFAQGFTTNYESVMVFGRATPVTDEKERHKALYKLAEKYLPEHVDKAEEHIQRHSARTAVYKISLELLTGKRRKSA
jgi:cytidylate kinase